MASTGTHRAAKPRTARRALTVAGLAIPTVAGLGTSAAAAYTVQSGDTLSDIAADNGYGSDWQSLYEANKGTVGDDPDLILPGQELDLGDKPTGTTATTTTARYVTHTVAAGDTLSKIADRYDVPGGWQRVYVDNKAAVGSDPAALRPGTELKIDTQGGKVTEPVTTEAETTEATQASTSTPSVPTTVSGIKAAAQKMMPADQFTCFSNIVQRESGWNYRATNPTSGAYGLMQALPGSKMATAGDDWRTNPLTQIEWGLGYMNDRYGSPCGAWSFWQANSWY
ncbi:hypothetical protein SRB5_22350 [Streptomyces sp. RB5]|uniref:LysM domain-containing protein n=1 Tax=Streptomyces smaragdinus TaxID=2585196 RepID=A0A7K0CF57_9ACTN|nr:LysM peptidoglycan-binding domain-containing protein [Streptomyces smaragdinus]MQY12105.1 hypothetical protein [Streptomyces smaragdinus]